VDPERVLDPIRATSATAAETRRYCLGSRRRDLFALVALVLIVLAGSPWLAVYHHVTLLDVSVVRIEPDGRRTAIPTPPLWRPPARRWAVPRGSLAAIRALEGRIHRVMRADPAIATAPPGTRFEWTVRYSENGTRLDRSVQFHTVPSDVAR
jgi:hypothetical protein